VPRDIRCDEAMITVIRAISRYTLISMVLFRR
jgi:hypothetical protein